MSQRHLCGSIQHAWHRHRTASSPRHSATATAAIRAQQYKQRQAVLWSAAAPKYLESDRLLKPVHEGVAAVVTSHLVAPIEPPPVQRLLEVCAGTGCLACALAAASRALEVTCTDGAPGMVAAAAARGRDLPNFWAAEVDAEDLTAFQGGAFDVVTCVNGLMFLPAHERALREWRRVLKPGGIAVVSVTGGAEDMEVADLHSAMLRALPAESAAPCGNPRTFGTVPRLLRAFAAAGFRDITARPCNVCMTFLPQEVDAFVRSNPIMEEAIANLPQHQADHVAKVAAVNVADAAARWGYITPDGTYIDLRRNMHTIITATASANANVRTAVTPTAAAAA